jgi:aryl-alcohol dehydrogenase-like predicted oxidoreductase
MARDEGMALAPWGALGQGQFLTEADRAKKDENNEGRKNKANDNHLSVSKALEAISKRRDNAPLTSLALAYVMHKYPYVYPIVGGRKIDHLKGNIEALELELSPEEIDEIDSATDFKVGFPMNFIFEFGEGQKFKTDMNGKDVGLLRAAANLDTVEYQKPIKPHKN